MTGPGASPRSADRGRVILSMMILGFGPADNMLHLFFITIFSFLFFILYSLFCRRKKKGARGVSGVYQSPRHGPKNGLGQPPCLVSGMGQSPRHGPKNGKGQSPCLVVSGMGQSPRHGFRRTGGPSPCLVVSGRGQSPRHDPPPRSTPSAVF